VYQTAMVADRDEQKSTSSQHYCLSGAGGRSEAGGMLRSAILRFRSDRRFGMWRTASSEASPRGVGTIGQIGMFAGKQQCKSE
jgi:hypothetical protein